MDAQVIDAGAIAADVRAKVAQAAAALNAAHGRPPCLAVVLVGDDPASHVYVAGKVHDMTEVGMRSIEIKLPAATGEAALAARVAALSADDDVDGILVQLPLPGHIDSNRVLAAIDPAKDVDGLTDVSAGKLALGKPGLRPCTPEGCVILAKSVRADLGGAHCVVVGRSNLVGKPAALLFLMENCTVTMAHSKTKALRDLCRSADILVPAMGQAEMVRGDWIKPGAIVIDVGIKRVPAPKKKNPQATKLVGDVAFDEAVAVAGAITRVPGGVGLMTRAGLLRNTVRAACTRNGWALPDL